MRVTDMIGRVLLRAAEAEGGGPGGVAPPPEAEGSTPPADAGATPPADGAGGEGAGGAGGNDRWWSGLGDEAQGFVKAKGLDARKPDEALAVLTDIARNAERKLGRPADSLITRPKEGQDVTEWLAEQREALGLPADVQGYAVKPPKDFPKEAWDGELAERAAGLAHQHAVPKSAHEAYVGLFAEYVQKLDASAGAQLEEARTKMMADIERDWGDAAETRITAASQAAQRLAEAAGLDGAAIEAMAATLSAKTGDANVLRLFDALARGMADDTATGMGKGAAGFSTGAADAKAELARLQAPGGEYYEAVAKGDTMTVERLKPRLKALRQAAAG